MHVLLSHSLQMYESKEMRSHLIQELRTTHALQAPEKEQKKREAEAIHSKQRAMSMQQHKVLKFTIV